MNRLIVINEHQGPVIGPDHADVRASQNRSGFETGQVVKHQEIYHMFVNEMLKANCSRALALTIGLFMAGNTLIAAQQQHVRSKPNIVLLLTDDQGYCDLSLHGNPILKTPVLDDFARESTVFTHFYASPYCVPTRASLMTGRYNYRVGVAINGSKSMFAEEVTLAESLKEAGYATALYGKWHLGDQYPHRPIDQGFDEVIRHTAGSIGVYPEGNSNFDPVLLENGKYKQFKGYSMDLYTDAALKFVERNKDRPFFLYLATNLPHRPLEALDEDAALYRQQGITGKTDEVYGMIANIDRNFDRILKKLKALGLEENTIVVFMSDNGPTDLDDDRWRLGLRGRKVYVWEGGIRVPFMVRWPAMFEGGRKIDTIAAHIDLMPTLLEACGIDPPQNVQFDGISLMPLLRSDQAGEAFDRTLYFQVGGSPELYQAFAARNQRFKPRIARSRTFPMRSLSLSSLTFRPIRLKRRMSPPSTRRSSRH